MARLRVLMVGERPRLARALRDRGAEVILAAPGPDLASVARDEDVFAVVGAILDGLGLCFDDGASDDEIMRKLFDPEKG